MEAAATGPDPLNAIGLAYVEFALQKRGLFRLMFGPILVERAKYPGLDEAARAVFDLLRREVVSWPTGCRARTIRRQWLPGASFTGFRHCSSTASFPRRAREDWQKKFSYGPPVPNNSLGCAIRRFAEAVKFNRLLPAFAPAAGHGGRMFDRPMPDQLKRA